MKNIFILILFTLAIFGQLFTISYAQNIASKNLHISKKHPVALPKIARNNEIIFNQKTYPINAIDPTIVNNTSASFYPGLRGANQLVIYTPNFGFRTGTNEFGTEAIVKGNVVNSISGADSIIPINGLVISAHGNAKIWMNENIILGSKIYIDVMNRLLTVYITSDSFLYSAKAKITETENIIAYYITTNKSYNFQKSFKYIKKAKDYLRKAEKHPKNVQWYSSKAIKAANSALANSLPYKPDELKGIWVRPTETSDFQIARTVKKIKKQGINDIFLETFFHGKTIFPSETMKKYKFSEQNEIFAGFDPLKTWMKEAHKRNMKVHIWFETFYVGNSNPINDSKSILGRNSSWANTTKKGYNSGRLTPSLSEHGGYFLDPANPEVQNFLSELLSEIIDKYSPDGINLDYIRYPQSIAAKYSSYALSNWGYTDYARNEFKASYGVDPVNLKYSDELWTNWDKYRQDNVSDFVKRISKITKANKVKLTTVIFPDRKKALETKQQDWKTWSANDYVDAFTPILLTCDAKTANAMMRDVIKNKYPKTDVYAGLFITFMGGSNEDLLRQIHETRKLKSNGIIMFDYAHFDDKYVNTLSESVFAPVKIAVKRQNKFKNNKIKRTKKRFFSRWR